MKNQKTFLWGIKVVVIFVMAMLLAGCSLFAPKEIEFTVYRMPADGSETLVAEKIQMKNNDKSLAENVIYHLINVKPISDLAYDDYLPTGTKLLGMEVKDGIAYVNFSKEVNKRTMGSYEATMFIGSIVNSLTELPDIKAVQILIEGEKKVMYCGVLDIEEPLVRNESLLKKPASN
ncbi:MAG: GerMN domain-containing protein [Phascolarctobacterium sp.]|nr:GerMN domain-containing protein [Candidatus Phascolarctobacterium caballi]